MKNIKYILGALVMVISLQSCESLLEQDNPNTVTTENATNTLNGINKINLGFYAALPAGGNVYNQSIITDEVVYPAGDNQNQGGGRDFYAWEYSPGTVTDRDNIRTLWIGYYNTINRTNTVIAGIDKVTPLTDADKTLKSLLRAEAYGMRAYSHYMLIRNFSPKYNATALGIPYKTVNDDNAKPSRLTMQESYAKILEDLNEAINTFPASTTVVTNYGGTYANNRLTKAALYGIRAQIALDMGDYANVITNANLAIGTRSLVSTKDDLVKLWSDTNDFQEVIFKQSNINSSGSNDLGGSWLYSNGSEQWNSSATLMTRYSTTDTRNALFIKKVGSLNTLDYMPGKYLLPYANGVKSIFGRGDFKLIRTAELILAKAEAYARNNDLANALIEYKKVRDARIAGTSSAFTSQTDALDKILDERSRELAYEGYRLNDLKRYGKTITRIAADSRINYPVLTMTNVNKLTLPIPQAEVFANENIKQNEGW